MINHVMVGTNDLEKAKAFYEKVLGVLGDVRVFENAAPSGHKRVFFAQGGDVFCLTQPIDDQPATAANGSTIGFKCASAEQVKEFHDVAVANGATSVEDPPGLRHAAIGDAHLAYFRDLDGHKICAIHRPG